MPEDCGGCCWWRWDAVKQHGDCGPRGRPAGVQPGVAPGALGARGVSTLLPSPRPTILTHTHHSSTHDPSTTQTHQTMRLLASTVDHHISGCLIKVYKVSQLNTLRQLPPPRYIRPSRGNPHAPPLLPSLHLPHSWLRLFQCFQRFIIYVKPF